MSWPSSPSEYSKLVEQLVKLAHELERPVSVADLRAYYQAHAAARPMLMGSLHILLGKAIRRPNKMGVHFVPIGKFGKAMYYAPDRDPVWVRRFHQFKSQNWLNCLGPTFRSGSNGVICGTVGFVV